MEDARLEVADCLRESRDVENARQDTEEACPPSFRMAVGHDHRLMEAVARGDAHAFRRLYEKYYPIIRTFITRRKQQVSSLEDVIQEVFVRLWSHRDRFRGQSAVSTFVHGIAINVVREDRRRRRELNMGAAEGLDDRSHLDGTGVLSATEEHVNRCQLRDVIEQTIAQLPKDQRRAVELVFIRGLSITDAARDVGCSYHTMRDHVNKALLWMRRHLSMERKIT